MNRFVCWFVKITGWIPFHFVFRPKYYYEDKAVQSRNIRGKAVIMPNHIQVWDFASVMFAFPAKNIHCVVAEVMFEKNKFFSWFLKKLGAVRTDREGADFAFLSQSEDILAQNGIVEIYPEARLPKEGEERPLAFKPSVTYIALSGHAPIIPVVTNGCYFSKHRLRILIGTPINVWEYYDEALMKKENVEKITTMLRERIITLNHELAERERKEKRH